MFVSATPRYEASSLSPLAKRASRDRGQRQDQTDHHEAPETPADAQAADEPDEPADVAFDLPDDTLGYSTALTGTPVAATLDADSDPGPTPFSGPSVLPAPKLEDTLFDLLERVVAKT